MFVSTFNDNGSYLIHGLCSSLFTFFFRRFREYHGCEAGDDFGEGLEEGGVIKETSPCLNLNPFLQSS